MTDTRTIYDHRVNLQRAAEREAGRLYAALAALLDAVNERPDLRQSIESVVLSDASNALLAARRIQ